ncbi:50S ribosomal protein L28 [Effusibacillus pohliae]|uniref:50S ribosomal protein L28 n=1 Tax=Effusibacillus pohliae TaxID=232270 RepID=UPI000363A1F8|nr:50S ribosomal protein L28 [Effusibacillus pohliae]
MAKRCAVCGKDPKTGNQISHSHIVTKRRWLPNLQRVRALVNGSVKRIHVCTRCLKAGKVKRAI